MKKVSLSVNGVWRQFVVEPDYVLLDLLRTDLRLTGTKQSCDRKGQCCACTVIMNGKAVRSCLVKAADLDGSSVVSIEGLGTPGNPHLIQEAFVLAGAIQCGFCTPGMIMATKALLDENADPTVDEIKQTLRRNLCRCTGYKKIIDAVLLAGRFLRGEQTPDRVRPDPARGLIGVSHPAPSAILKACGVAEFTADIYVKGAAELAAVHSPHAHALIKSIDTSTAEQMAGVIGVMTAKDVKGTNRLKMIVPDRPVLCPDKVRYIGDPVAAVLAETKEQAAAAAAAVEVEYEPLPVVMTPEEALAEGACQVDPDRPNLCYSTPLRRGDAEGALAASAVVLETDFSTQTNHQAPLEPEACVAYLEDGGDGDLPTLVVIGRSINIHFHMGMLQDALGYENIRYEEGYVGGQFGIKVDITSEALASAAALRFKRPVRYIPGLQESMWLTPKRHAFDMKVRLGADAEGKLTGYTIDFTVNNGAYYSNGNIIINRALHMLSGSYYIPAIEALARLVYTNSAYGAAARGAGPPQVNFALESAMDILAARMGVDPLEFRLKNLLKPGEPKATGHLVDQWPLPGLYELMRPHYDRARRDAAELNRAGGATKRGAGLGSGSFGIGGAGDSATVAVELDPDGGLTIFAAAANPGEGTDAMLVQIAAYLMGLPIKKIRLVTRSTGSTTAAGPAAGSRITYMVGGALVEAIGKLKAVMEEIGATREQLEKAGRPFRYLGTRKNEGGKSLDPETGQGASFVTEAHALQLAEVDVNTQTGQVRVVKMTTAVDAGRIINPMNVEGQLEGGMDMGVGFALRERYVEGRTTDWISFKFPTIRDSFEMETLIRETPRSKGPLGATGVGEMTMVPTAPAITNAIANACGARVCALPATPDKVLAALAQAKK